jgi:hypothetical protein
MDFITVNKFAKLQVGDKLMIKIEIVCGLEIRLLLSKFRFK